MIVSTSLAVACIVTAGSFEGTGRITTVVVTVVKDAPELGDIPLSHTVLPAEFVT